MVTGLRNGISARSSAPTFSITCARSSRRFASNHLRPVAFSSIHPRAYCPLRISSSIFFISFLVSAVTTLGPPV
jgi:hypothetical protein